MTMEVDPGTEVPDPPAVLKEHTGLKWSVATDSESGLICLPLEYEEKELEKTPLPREVVRVSQLLLMGTLSNFTLSKRQEMLDKSPIPEPLKETLLFSSLVKDKLFGLPCQQQP
jgi:hypothetical protein